MTRFSFKKKHKGVETRVGNHDRRAAGRWATHIWGIILLVAFSSGGFLGYNLRADTSSIERSITSVSEGDSIRSQVILDSLISLSQLFPDTIERTIVRTVLVPDTTWMVDTLFVAQEPQIIRVRDTVNILVVDSVFVPPTIITIPPVQYGFFDSRHFVPNAGNIAYLIVGAALGSIIDNDASACVFLSTNGKLEKNCDPKR